MSLSVGVFYASLLLQTISLVPNVQADINPNHIGIPAHLPGNWTYSGCQTDSTGSRSLKGAQYDDSSLMTVESCIAFCSSKGFVLAGTEYSQECYCGNSLASNSELVPDSDCSMLCKGDSNETCGGSNRLSVYTSGQLAPAGPVVNPGPDSWVSLGCYVDEPGRTLTAMSTANDNNTVDTCVFACQQANYEYAGVEYSRECYCGNSLANGGGPAFDGFTQCSMTCSGNSTEYCGGPNRLNLYQFNTTATPVTAISTTTSTVLVTAPSTIRCPASNDTIYTSQDGELFLLECFIDRYGNDFIIEYTDTYTSCLDTCAGTANCVALSWVPPGPALCYMKSAIGAGIQNQGVWGARLVNNSSGLLPSTAIPLALDFGPLGCYNDSVSARSLAVGMDVLGGAGNMTQVNCIIACSGAGYTIAGVEYSQECYCDYKIRNGGAPAFDGSNGCDMPCSGDASENCGGPDRLLLFQRGAVSSSTTSPITVISTSTMTTTTTSPVANITVSTTVLPTNQSVVVSATTSISTATPGSTHILSPLPPGWSLQGCWDDNVPGFGRSMVHDTEDASDMSIELCVQRCIQFGYTIAGLEFSTQCFCDNFIHNNASSSPASDCFMNCGGNSSEICGGPNRLSVYSNASITVLPVPVPQKTNLPGNWTYAGCISDNTNGRVFPHQLVSITKNSASWCLSQCQAFGYMAGGLEYSQECYCGDVADLRTYNATFMAESDCSMPCTGSLNYVCGGPNRISYYNWTATPIQTWSYPNGNAAGKYQFLVGGVVIPLMTQQNINGKITFLEKFGTGAPNTTGAYEMDLTSINNFIQLWRPMHVKTDIFCSAGLLLPDKAGRQINIGGWSGDSTFGIRLYTPDGSAGSWGVNDWQEDGERVALQNGRWYPSNMIMGNGSILVVGGEDGSNGMPVPTIEILPPTGPVITMDWLERTDPYNLYPFIALLPSGGIFAGYYNEARVLDPVTFATTKVLQNMPGSINYPDGGRTYPLEGAMMLLPQYAPYTDPLGILICGGSSKDGDAFDNCISTHPERDEGWTLEHGTYLITNGAQEGTAGFGLASNPNLNALLYDPSKPINQRMSVMANTTIARLYHSEALLLLDGRVMISGSDPQDPKYPEEYRIEQFLPPYLLSGVARPNFTITNTDWAYKDTISFQVTTPIVDEIHVSLIGAVSSTHGNSMGQRTIFPAVACTVEGDCKVTAPPNANICPPGWFQMFVLDGPTPGVGIYVRIGGDPARFGDWPNYPAFLPLPGV